MRHLLLAGAAALVLSACADGYDRPAAGTPVRDGGSIVRWTAPGEAFPSDVRPGRAYVSAWGVELNR